ncbi:MAG TPA: ABC transporter substrate-binding protein [Planctomycetota bacterium]|nr:ABC transporter substrate-binding protein [Planctomycetota bacterium]
MRRERNGRPVSSRRSRACALLLAGLALAVAPVEAADRAPLRVAVIATQSGSMAAAGEETWAGARHAAAVTDPSAGPETRRVEVVRYDDADDPAEVVRAYEAAVKARADAVVAAATGRTVDALVARARKGRVPLILVGSAPPRPILDGKDPVLFLGAWPVDHALAVVNALAAPCGSKKPGFVVEDTPRGHELEAAIQRNLGPSQSTVGAVRVPPGSAPASALAGLRDAGCDRLVVVGEPALLESALRALEGLHWDVPVLASDGTLSGAAPRARDLPPDRVLFLAGLPQLLADGSPRALLDALDAESKADVPAVPMPRTLLAWMAVRMLAASARGKGVKPPKDADLLAALKDQRYGDAESRTPYVGTCGYASLLRWIPWRTGPKGPEPIEANRLPAEGFGPVMGLRAPARYRAEPGCKVVVVSFGEEKSRPPKTIEKDLAELGLGTRGYEGTVDFRVREELLARVLGKMNRLFLRNEDGTAIPGVSFAVSFVTERPKDVKPHDAFTVVIAGDDDVAGGRAFPGEGRAEVYATYLRRTIFQPNALDPPVGRPDLESLSGSAAVKGVPLEHLRADRVRCLIDGYAGSMALTGAHEVGHLFGLGHDETDPRSIMNVAEGAGLRETQAWFIPAHAAVIERAVGRSKDPAASR